MEDLPMRRRFLTLALGGLAAAALAPVARRAQAATGPALPEDIAFRGITGGELRLADWRGRPVLVVNTASRCGFTRQYDDLQRLYDRFGEAGLVVLAVPSNDFNQELASDAAVAEFCEVNFGLSFPMAGITPLRGAGAHPFYAWLSGTHGVAPRWNFTKVLIGPDGRYRGSWGSMVNPMAPPITRAVEAALRG